MARNRRGAIGAKPIQGKKPDSKVTDGNRKRQTGVQMIGGQGGRDFGKVKKGVEIVSRDSK